MDAKLSVTCQFDVKFATHHVARIDIKRVRSRVGRLGFFHEKTELLQPLVVWRFIASRFDEVADEHF